MSLSQMVHYQAKLEYEMDSSDLYSACEINDHNYIIVDGRSPEAFAVEHIPEAINLWHKELNTNNTAQLDRNKTYVCYCDGIGCNASTKTALKLLTLGFKVKELIGGLDWWKRDGYATSQSAAIKNKIDCGC